MKHNTVIMFEDSLEKRTHQTDADIRRYARSRQACTAWRFIPEKKLLGMRIPYQEGGRMMNDILTVARIWAGMDGSSRHDVEGVLDAETPEELEHVLLWSNGLPSAVRELRQPLKNIDTREARGMLAKLEHAVEKLP